MSSRSPWALTRHVDLSTVGAGWNGCGAVVTVLSQLEKSQFADQREAVLKGAEGASDTDYTKLVIALVKKHFVKGTMLTFADDGDPTTRDIDFDDLDSAPQNVLDLLLGGTLGVIPDPKASSTPTETSPIEKPTRTLHL